MRKLNISVTELHSKHRELTNSLSDKLNIISDALETTKDGIDRLNVKTDELLIKVDEMLSLVNSEMKKMHNNVSLIVNAYASEILRSENEDLKFTVLGDLENIRDISAVSCQEIDSLIKSPAFTTNNVQNFVETITARLHDSFMCSFSESMNSAFHTLSDQVRDNNVSISNSIKLLQDSVSHISTSSTNHEVVVDMLRNIQHELHDVSLATAEVINTTKELVQQQYHLNSSFTELSAICASGNNENRIGLADLSSLMISSLALSENQRNDSINMILSTALQAILNGLDSLNNKLDASLMHDIRDELQGMLSATASSNAHHCEQTLQLLLHLRDDVSQLNAEVQYVSARVDDISNINADVSSMLTIRDARLETKLNDVQNRVLLELNNIENTEASENFLACVKNVKSDLMSWLGEILATSAELSAKKSNELFLQESRNQQDYIRSKLLEFEEFSKSSFDTSLDLKVELLSSLKDISNTVTSIKVSVDEMRSQVNNVEISISALLNDISAN
jgi:hypothetical protein